MVIGEEKIKWIDAPPLLEGAVADILRSYVVAVDTEYDSFRYFREKLCLVQLATLDVFYLFDPLSGLDLSDLGEIFSCPQILKIFHAGENDIRLLKRDYGFCVKNIFDTAKAASLLGEEHLALAHLVRKYLGMELEKKKSIQRSRWDQRPLSSSQIAYATLDVAYLFDLHRVLADELKARGCLEEAKAAFEAISTVSWRGRPFRPRGYRRFVEQGSLSAIEERKLKALYEWRYFLAADLDLAPFMILSDSELVEVARKGLAALSPEKRQRWGEEIEVHVFGFKK